MRPAIRALPRSATRVAHATLALLKKRAVLATLVRLKRRAVHVTLVRPKRRAVHVTRARLPVARLVVLT